MQKSLILSIFISLLHVNISLGDWHEPKETKTILVLFGLHPSQPAYRPILDGIRKKIIEEFGDAYTLHTEYL